MDSPNELNFYTSSTFDQVALLEFYHLTSLEVIFNPNYLTQPKYIATGIDANNTEITIENTDPANSMVEAYFLWFNPND